MKLASTTGLDDPIWPLRRHFRRFSDVEFEDDGRIVNFRYYDPATLRTYLPTCNDDELRRFFGPVRTFFGEAFSEVASLGRSEQAWAMQLAESQCLVLWELNIIDNLRRQVRFDAITATASRKTNGYWFIRTAQNEAFRQQQERQFSARVVDYLAYSLGVTVGPRFTALGKRVDSLLADAKSEGFTTEANLTNFVIASFFNYDKLQAFRLRHRTLRSETRETDIDLELRDIADGRVCSVHV